MSAQRLLILSILFLPTLGVGQHQARDVQKDFSWGSVSLHKQAGSATARIRFSLAEDPESRTAKAEGTNERRFSSLFRSFYLALPAGVVLQPTVTAIEALQTTSDMLVVSGYTQSTDSAALVATYRRVDETDLKELSKTIAVEGYEWFRGVRLARIRIGALLPNDGELRQIKSIDVRFTYVAGPSGTDARTLGKDPHFEIMLRSAVVNEEELASISSTPLSWSDTTGGWFSASQRYVKLAIPDDGIYRIRSENLAPFVQDIGQIDPRTFQLFNYGREVPLVVVGEENGQFETGEYIEFPARRNYGRKNYRTIPAGNEEYPEYLNRYTDTSFYWLTWGGQNGQRVPSNVGTPSSVDTLTWYTEVVHIEQNNMIQLIGGDVLVHQDPRWLAGDVWAWGFLSANSSFEATFSASDMSPDYPTGRVLARFASWGAQSVTPAHRVRLRLNNSDTLHALDLQQYQHALMDATVSVSQFVEGTNTIRTHSLPTSSTTNFLLFDWAEAEYPRQLKARGDTLFFEFKNISGPSVRTVSLTGFSTGDVIIYKVSPFSKSISFNSASQNGSVIVSFSDTVNNGDRYYAVVSTKVKTPIIGAPKSFTGLRNRTRGADYLTITHRRFLPLASQYSSFVGSTYGVRTSVIDVQDVFDEFGYGYPTPESIREFLKATTLWQSPMPSYLLLAGDASYDFKNHVFVPNPANRPFNSVPSLGFPVSDPWLAVMDDNSITPNMYVGRIPVNTEAEFMNYIQRAQSYVNARNDDWNKRYLFFAGGDPNTAGQIQSFRNVNDGIISSMVQPAPIGGLATHFYKTTSPQSDFGPYSPAKIRETIDNGTVFINYIGHSGTQTWDNSIGDVTQLANKRGRYTLISDFGCSTAKFAEPNIKAFGELFTVSTEGSAIAYVGNSALGFVSIAVSLPQLFYKQFLVNNVTTIGTAHLAAKIERMNQSGGSSVLLNRVMMLTNSLIGDPIIKLAIPPKPNLAVRGNAITTSPERPTDDDEALHVKIPFENNGRVTNDTVLIKLSRTFSGLTTDTIVVRPLPLFRDTLDVRWRIRELAGEHRFAIDLNSSRTVPEVHLDENTAQHNVIVLSNSFKALHPLPYLEQPANELRLLNPQRSMGGSRTVELQIDTTALFTKPLTLSTQLGVRVTSFALPTLQPLRTYFWRARIGQTTNPWSEGLFIPSADSTTRWVQRDSTAWYRSNFHNVEFVRGRGVQVAKRFVNIRLISSGFDDGGFGAVEVDGANILPSTFGRGFSVALLDTGDFSVREIVFFNNSNTSSDAWADSLASYINATDGTEFVVALIIGDGQPNLNTNAKSALRAVGSVYIDSVTTRDSWAIIGRKGAAPGSVVEQMKRRGQGRVLIDTTFLRSVQGGEIISSEIGPTGTWHSIKHKKAEPPGSQLRVGVIGRNASGKLDTLLWNQSGTMISLSSVSSRQYRTIQLVGALERNANGESPILEEWSVELTPPAELSVDYQTVSVSTDSVLEGQPVNVNVSVHNVGYTAADSFLIAVKALTPAGIEHLARLMVPSLKPDSAVTVGGIFSTAGKRGTNTLIVEIDSAQSVSELYHSNNFYSTPIFVVTDTVAPLFDVTFDGNRIFDGDYVGVTPEIRVSIRDNSPLAITNPSNATLKLNNRRITLGTYPDSLFETKTGAEKAAITFRPRLARGNHILSIQVSDASGNLADTSAMLFRFKVESDSKILQAFNYPNPFTDATNFTFNLTGARLPEELVIKIYTVAGRLIREIKVQRPELRFGFNSVSWDGRDADGAELANGVYFYKIMMQVDDKSEEVIQKLAKIR